MSRIVGEVFLSSIGIINTDSDIASGISQAFSTKLDFYEARVLTNYNEIVEFLNYELPEVIIVNFSDPQLNTSKLVDVIKNQTWFLSFGIIGIYKHSEDTSEKDILLQLKELNILTLLDQYRIRSHIIKCVEIIEENYQIIFQREFSKNLLGGSSGSFSIGNDIFSIPLFAGIVASIVAQRGLMNPENKMLLQLALAELIINGVEHGNCGIGYDAKTEGMEKGLSVVELVAESCKDPEIAAKRVTLSWDIREKDSVFTIQDEGKGFDVQKHLKKVETQDDLSLHGRGIKMALMVDGALEYNDVGNEVTLTIQHNLQVVREVPAGFASENIYKVKKGDVVFKESDKSDFLFYIVSGQYSVYHKNKKVGSLSVDDIFMGEMSFLLNKSRSATVKADTEGKLIRLSRKTFVGVIRDYPHYGIFLSKILAKRLVRSNTRFAKEQNQDQLQ